MKLRNLEYRAYIPANFKNFEYRAYIPANFKNFKWLSGFYRFFHISAKFRHHYKIYNLWELYWCWMEMFGNFNISSLLTHRKKLFHALHYSKSVYNFIDLSLTTKYNSFPYHTFVHIKDFPNI